MKIFRGNDEFLTPEYIVEWLRETAKDEAKRGEYHPAEHTCWIAADIIEKQNDVITNKAPEIWLRDLADKMEHIEWMDKDEWVRKEDVVDG